MEYIFITLVGLVIGSFLNVCIYRLPRGENLAWPPSHCGSCGERLSVGELIPVLSYLCLGGRCRHCKSVISPQYPLVELLCAVLYLGLFVHFGWSGQLAGHVFLFTLLIVISVIDLKSQDVYTSTILAGLLGGAFYLLYIYSSGGPVRDLLLGAFAGLAVIGVIVIVSRGGMGWGDAEIALLCGLFLGLRLTLVALFFSFLLGGLVGAVLLLLRRRKGKDSIPFGPFIALGALLSVFYGEPLLAWYLTKM